MAASRIDLDHYELPNFIGSTPFLITYLIRDTEMKSFGYPKQSRKMQCVNNLVTLVEISLTDWLILGIAIDRYHTTYTLLALFSKNSNHLTDLPGMQWRVQHFENIDFLFDFSTIFYIYSFFPDCLFQKHKLAYFISSYMGIE